MVAGRLRFAHPAFYRGDVRFECFGDVAQGRALGADVLGHPFSVVCKKLIAISIEFQISLIEVVT